MKKRTIIILSFLLTLFLGVIAAMSIYAENSTTTDPSGRRNCCKMPTYKRGKTVTDCTICDENLDFEGTEDDTCPF